MHRGAGGQAWTCKRPLLWLPGGIWLGFAVGKAVADVFCLHELAVEDAVHAHQRPKLERYDKTLFLVLKTVNYVEHASVSTAREIV